MWVGEMKRKRERERERGRGLIQRPVERGGPWASVAPRGRAACAARSQSCGVRLPWRMGAAHPCDTLDQPDSAITWHLFLLATIQLLMSWAQPEIIWSYGVTGCTMDSESSDRGSNPRRTSLPLAMSRQTRRGQRSYPINLAVSASVGMTVDMGNAETRDRTGDLQIVSLTLSQLSYRGPWYLDTTSLP